MAPPAVDFEQVVIGCESRERAIELINVASTPRTFRQAAFPEGTTPEFELRQPPRGTTIPPGGSVVLQVRYAPVDEGHDDASLMAWIEEQEEPVWADVAGWSRGPTSVTETWVQHRRAKLDMLVVLDNGATMDEEAARFAAELGGLPVSLGLQNLDYHLAVTTTSLVASTGGACPGGADGGEDGRFFPVSGVRPRIVSTGLPNAESVWVANLGVGACGSAAAQPLEAALRALTEPLATSLDDPRHPEADDGNLGFLRSDAHLSILVVSDRDDASPRSPAEYHQAFQAVKGPRNLDLLSFHTVGGDDAGCTAGDGRSGAATPRLLDVSGRTLGGTAASICGTDWAPPVAWVHDGPRSCFFLAQHPWDRNADGVVSADDGEVTLALDGDGVSARTPEGDQVWSYREDLNAVCFSPLAVPEPGSLIQISYAQPCRL